MTTPRHKARRAPITEAWGTSLQGYVETAYHNLVEAFGEPDPGGDKVRVEWTLRFGPTIVTIYDWKTTGPIEQVTRWNVGGSSHGAVVEVARALGVRALPR
jgi:hypothetical protein